MNKVTRAPLLALCLPAELVTLSLSSALIEACERPGQAAQQQDESKGFCSAAKPGRAPTEMKQSKIAINLAPHMRDWLQASLAPSWRLCIVRHRRGGPPRGQGGSATSSARGLDRMETARTYTSSAANKAPSSAGLKSKQSQTNLHTLSLSLFLVLCLCLSPTLQSDSCVCTAAHAQGQLII